MKRSTFTLAVAAFAAIFPSTAKAWSFKEHIQFTRLAAQRIIDDPAASADLKAWLKTNTPLLGSTEAERDFFLHAAIGEKPDASKLSGLTWWVCVPDIESLDRSGGSAEPAGKHERLNHFIDLEFFNPAGPKRTFQPDLSAMPALADIPNDIKNATYEKAGYLPIARQNAYDRLVASIRAGKLAPDPKNVEDQDHAVRWAGYLVHYTQDNTQPHHATMDFMSRQYFKGIKNPPNVHAEMEYRMADDATQPLPELREEFWKAFERELANAKDTVQTPQIFTSTLEVSASSYRALPLIGEAARAAMIEGEKPSVDTAKFFHYAGTVDGKPTTVLDMKARQTAWAVVRTEAVLKQAWTEATAK